MYLNFREYEKVEKSIDQVREDAKMHLKEKDTLEKLIPMFIVIGPFHIATNKLRESLSNKRRQMADIVLNYQTNKVKIKAEELNGSFRDIQRKLFEKPNNMEELSEHREWMKSIPGLLDDKKVR
jgi:dynein heavy chain, axonemal